MTVRREILQNDSQTTLDGALNNSDTSFSVDDGSVFPSTGDFRVLLDSEIMLCTARSGNTLTVVRAQDGTTAASHPDSTPVIHVLTEDALERYCRDNDYQFNSSRPPLRLVDGSGNTINNTNFTKLDGSTTATVADLSGGGISVVKPGSSGVDMTALIRSAPSTPYSVVAAVSMLGVGTGSHVMSVGLGFRDNSSGKVIKLQYRSDSTRHLRLTLNKYDSLTAFDSTYLSTTFNLFVLGNVLWQKIEDDGTNIKAYLSPDGETWHQLHSVSRTDYMAGGPDEIGFFVNNQANTATGTTVIGVLAAWDEGA